MIIINEKQLMALLTRAGCLCALWSRPELTREDLECDQGNYMEIAGTDFNEIAVCAFRYALGRSTYVVGNVANILIRHSEFINAYERITMISEISKAIKKGKAGENCDIEEWNKLKIALEKLNKQQSREVEE